MSSVTNESGPALEKVERRHQANNVREMNVAVLYRVAPDREGMTSLDLPTFERPSSGGVDVNTVGPSSPPDCYSPSAKSIVPPLNLSRLNLARQPTSNHCRQGSSVDAHVAAQAGYSAGALEWYKGSNPHLILDSREQQNKMSSAFVATESSERAAARTTSIQSKLGLSRRSATSGRTVSMQSSFNRSEASDASTRRGSFYDSSNNFANMLLREEKLCTAETEYCQSRASYMYDSPEGAAVNGSSWTNESSLDYFDLDDYDDESASRDNLYDPSADWLSPSKYDSVAVSADSADSAEKLRLVANSGSDMIVCADIGKRPRLDSLASAFWVEMSRERREAEPR